ncbi:MAG: RluA family pseudouridine synthase [Oscillospiraceae bacterium]|nr:RluA family pseudouridine synthase [Oscillospiraceae bacterium]
MSIQVIHVNADAPMSLQDYLRKHAQISARMLKRLKQADKGITRNGVLIRSIDQVYGGDTLILNLPETCSHTSNPALDVPVVYESPQIIVCSKPVGMPVHPSMLHREDTLANWFAAYYPNDGFHALNRLDNNTSGLCLVAKTAYAAHALRKGVQKKYYALVPGGFECKEGTIDAPIARQQESVITRCVREDGQRAVTHYRVIAEKSHCAFVECRLETGRTHQIRVHFSYIGHPLFGDDLYGGDCSILKHQALHCGELTFVSPDTHEEICLSAPIRRDMQAFWDSEV